MFAPSRFGFRWRFRAALRVRLQRSGDFVYRRMRRLGLAERKAPRTAACGGSVENLPL
jgi:hypothetical protein